VLFVEVAETSAAIAQASARKKKVALLAELLKKVPAGERAICAHYLSGEVGHKLGIGYATVHEMRGAVAPAQEAGLTLAEVDARFAAIAALSGAGSQKARKDTYGALLGAATAIEQGFIGAIVVGELRQGALDALVVDATAQATGIPQKRVRTAYMLTADIGVVCAAAFEDGNVDRFGLTLFRPVLPMLAQTAEDTGEALENFDGAPMSLELKLDGFRVQIHKDGDEIRAYSRALNDVTASVPEVVAAVRALGPSRLILDGEAIAYGENGRPLPFQDTMKRKSESGGALSLSVFDILLAGEQTMLSAPARERFTVLETMAPTHAVPRIITADRAEAAAFYEKAIGQGHEGVMAKALDSTYDAGNRGAAWLKIKKVRRLDLVVLAAEWGSGRRKGRLSNIWLGARDPNGGEHVMLGKTFKGMTDVMLEWQTAQFLAREIDREGHIVHVRPEIVAEVAFNDVQRSSQYPGGLALRHARVVRYRDDKTAAEADTIDAVRAIAIADGVLVR
jgi:DNA ligase 1